MVLVWTVGHISSFSPSTLAVFALAAAALLFAIRARLSDTLSHIPGPLIARLTSWWIHWRTYIGDECTVIDQLHRKYGPIVRIAPNEVVIADGAALAPIMTARGGFVKADCYAKFDLGGHETIFSTRDASYRAKRAKAVLPLFSPASVRAGGHKLEQCAEDFVRRLRQESQAGTRSVNVHHLARAYALDSVCSYLFDRPYGALHEAQQPMSASPWVSAIVAFGRYFNMPNAPFHLLIDLYFKYFVPEAIAKSGDKVTGYSDSSVQSSQASSETHTYQGRLLHLAQITPRETAIQVEDVMFAGTDSTGTNLATLCHYLVQNKPVYRRLQAELRAAAATATTTADATTPTPYLDAVVRETLRISHANPTRKPRVVPAQGWTYHSPKAASGAESSPPSFYLPGGTIVGLQEWTLHRNADVFPDPSQFLPERWLPSSSLSPSSSSSLASPSSPPSSPSPRSPSSSSGITSLDKETDGEDGEVAEAEAVVVASKKEEEEEKKGEWKARQQLMRRDWVPFGTGPRQCIAQNLAFAELVVAARALALSDVLSAAECGAAEIEVLQWFNSVVKGEKVELVWR